MDICILQNDFGAIKIVQRFYLLIRHVSWIYTFVMALWFIWVVSDYQRFAPAHFSAQSCSFHHARPPAIYDFIAVLSQQSGCFVGLLIYFAVGLPAGAAQKADTFYVRTVFRGRNRGVVCY